MSNRRILGFTWLAFAAVTWLCLHRFVQWIWVDLMGRATLVGGVEVLTVPVLFSFVITALAAWGTWRHDGIRGYCLETVAELRKVVWPGRDELRDSTIVVIGAVFFFAAVLGGFDWVWAKITNFILYRAG